MIPDSWQPGAEGLRLLLGRKSVVASALRKDLETLEQVMQRAYGGWETAVARGWNWETWFARWKSQLDARGSARIPFDEGGLSAT